MRLTPGVDGFTIEQLAIMREQAVPLWDVAWLDKGLPTPASEDTRVVQGVMVAVLSERQHASPDFSMRLHAGGAPIRLSPESAPYDVLGFLGGLTVCAAVERHYAGDSLLRGIYNVEPPMSHYEASGGVVRGFVTANHPSTSETPPSFELRPHSGRFYRPLTIYPVKDEAWSADSQLFGVDYAGEEAPVEKGDLVVARVTGRRASDSYNLTPPVPNMPLPIYVLRHANEYPGIISS